MALGILNTMVPHLWLYLIYWWTEVYFSPTRTTFDRLYLADDSKQSICLVAFGRQFLNSGSYQNLIRFHNLWITKPLDYNLHISHISCIYLIFSMLAYYILTYPPRWAWGTLVDFSTTNDDRAILWFPRYIVCILWISLYHQNIPTFKSVVLLMLVTKIARSMLKVNTYITGRILAVKRLVFCSLFPFEIRCFFAVSWYSAHGSDKGPYFTCWPYWPRNLHTGSFNS